MTPEQKQRRRESYKKWREKNKEYDKQRCREYKARNREKIAQYNKQWTKENLNHKLHLNALRRARQLQATPAWADLEAIKEFYLNRPEGYHVDHIIPLCHPNVCGLHVLENLQYLPAEDNLKKNNRWDWGV